MNGGAATPFVIKGVDYSPRPINDAARRFPDRITSGADPAHLTYGPIWMRDLWGATYNDDLAQVNFPDGLVRQLGANSIRTYAWWKWVPMSPADYSKWNKLDWSVSPRVRFGATAAPAGFAGWPAHDGGDQFLDLCWNHGVNPIYVVIGISVDPWLAFAGTNPDSTLSARRANVSSSALLNGWRSVMAIIQRYRICHWQRNQPAIRARHRPVH